MEMAHLISGVHQHSPHGFRVLLQEEEKIPDITGRRASGQLDLEGQQPSIVLNGEIDLVPVAGPYGKVGKRDVGEVGEIMPQEGAFPHLARTAWNSYRGLLDYLPAFRRDTAVDVFYFIT